AATSPSLVPRPANTVAFGGRCIAAGFVALRCAISQRIRLSRAPCRRRASTASVGHRICRKGYLDESRPRAPAGTISADSARVVLDVDPSVASHLGPDGTASQLLSGFARTHGSTHVPGAGLVH